ncbi:sulfur reduction protein DsrE [Anaerobacillus arseniciselenatis]|uniref:Sulfur reduction protein DsrE n=1 Tax=Anaerobacillus arseniciselenatis TaxID=85682 RepID=A0A1S2LSA7_9BACI|nr:DsrE family protein [Anaerobacillus arseniciselenatis]OIJ14547.1 sulfur reduction protein DsrE [Anaerobacillus arseniciselenatis]
MTNKFLVSLTNGKSDTDRATVGFVVANAAVASGKEVVVFLNIDGAYLSDKGYADDIHESGFAPLKDLMDQFVEAGGVLWVCSPCHKKRELSEENLIEGATIVGGAKVVEFLSEGAASITY